MSSNPNFSIALLDGHRQFVSHEKFQQQLHRQWQEQRRFTLKNLKDLGFGKSSMEILIQEEIEKCIEMLRQEVGKPTQLNLKLNIAILNALWKLLTGEKVKLKSSHQYQFVNFNV